MLALRCAESRASELGVWHAIAAVSARAEPMDHGIMRHAAELRVLIQTKSSLGVWVGLDL